MKELELSTITTYQAGTAQATMNRLLQKKCDEILKPFGITKMHWLIIGNALDAGKYGVSVSELADRLATTIPYLTNTLNLLESRGYISKVANDKDGRSKLVKVNPNFKSKCSKIENALREGLRISIYATVDPDEFRIYMKVVYQLKNVKLSD